MKSDDRVQINTIVVVYFVALGILAIYLWPEAEAADSQCDVGIYYMPSNYRVVGFESIAHLADMNDKMSDPAESKKAVFDPVEELVYQSPVWIQPSVKYRPESGIQRPRYSDMPIAGGYWIGDSVIRTPVTCDRDVSEPDVIWLMLIGSFLLMAFRNKNKIGGNYD